MYRALDLEDIITRQEYQIAVRFDALDVRNPMVPRASQKVDDGALVDLTAAGRRGTNRRALPRWEQEGSASGCLLRDNALGLVEFGDGF
jgi:hypothetical protein